MSHQIRHPKGWAMGVQLQHRLLWMDKRKGAYQLEVTLKVEVKMWIPFLSFLTMSTLAIYELAYRASLMGWLDVLVYDGYSVAITGGLIVVTLTISKELT